MFGLFKQQIIQQVRFFCHFDYIQHLKLEETKKKLEIFQFFLKIIIRHCEMASKA
jgi:hypothetical protein